MDTPVGTVEKFYPTGKMAVMTVARQPVKVGDMIKFSGPRTDFSQRIHVLQVGYRQVESVSPGEVCAVGVDQAVSEGDTVFLVSAL